MLFLLELYPLFWGLLGADCVCLKRNNWLSLAVLHTCICQGFTAYLTRCWHVGACHRVVVVVKHQNWSLEILSCPRLAPF